jgi:hypothetical protein
MLKREFPAEFKTLDNDDGVGTFEGVASVFGNLDRQQEIITAGAFQKTLEGFLSHGFLANAHDWSQPIGTISEARETDEGLYVKGIFHSTPHAQAARIVASERLKRGAAVGMSIGYDVVDSAYDEKSRIRTLKELELFEVSLVTVPANPLAQLSRVKAIDEAQAEAEALETRRQQVRQIQLARIVAERDFQRLINPEDLHGKPNNGTR